MPKNFKAIVIDNKDEKFTREVKDLNSDHLKDGNVLVKIDFSSLNFKDALILNNGGRIVKKYPFVPGIDFPGTVEESEDDKFKKDDNVILTGFRVGEIYYGGFSQYAKVNSDFLVKLPKNLTNKKAMMMGTAGLTTFVFFCCESERRTFNGVKSKRCTGNWRNRRSRKFRCHGFIKNGLRCSCCNRKKR